MDVHLVTIKMIIITQVPMVPAQIQKKSRNIKKNRHPSSTVEQHVPFNSNRYPDSANDSLYMSPTSSPPRNQTYDRKHRKKKLGSYSRRTKPNKLNLIAPLPDYQLNSNYYSLKYNRK